MLSSVKSLLDKILTIENQLLGKKWLISILIIGNFLGAIIGFDYYLNTIGIDEYHPILWLIIPDCPMATLLLVGFYLQGKNQRYHNFNLLALVQGVRGALFTYLIVSNFPSIDIGIVMLGHSLLLIQAFLILPQLLKLEVNKATGIIILITFLNDFLDFFGFLTIIPPTLAQLPTIEPMFIQFVIVISTLDIIMLLLGILLQKIVLQESKVSGSGIL